MENRIMVTVFWIPSYNLFSHDWKWVAVSFVSIYVTKMLKSRKQSNLEPIDWLNSLLYDSIRAMTMRMKSYTMCVNLWLVDRQSVHEQMVHTMHLPKQQLSEEQLLVLPTRRYPPSWMRYLWSYWHFVQLQHMLLTNRTMLDKRYTVLIHLRK